MKQFLNRFLWPLAPPLERFEIIEVFPAKERNGRIVEKDSRTVSSEFEPSIGEYISLFWFSSRTLADSYEGWGFSKIFCKDFVQMVHKVEKN